MENCFDPRVSKRELPTVECKDLQSPFRKTDRVNSIIKQQFDKDYLMGPFEKLSFDRYRASQICIVKGNYSEERA